jgi:hypothetical protein
MLEYEKVIDIRLAAAGAAVQFSLKKRDRRSGGRYNDAA